jgi:phospholipid/cholesterol/gamma-HCH transport system ATP-binding protein
MTDTPLILENVSLSFGTRLALDELNLAFRRGITTVIIGTSGSGKSLALKTSAGLLFPDEGEAYFEGRKIAMMNETEYQHMQSRTGFHFQDAALWANKSLKENLTLPLMAGKVNLSDREIDERVEEAFGSVNLDVDPESRPASISMGQRKMVSFSGRPSQIRRYCFWTNPPHSWTPAVSDSWCRELKLIKTKGGPS